MTRLSKDTLTFDLGPTVWAHKAGAFSALKLYSGRKYLFIAQSRMRKAVYQTTKKRKVRRRPPPKATRFWDKS